jgi:DNA-binding NarL/FixJ family response regulator
MTFDLSEAPNGTHDAPAGTLVDLERARVARPLGRAAPAPTVRVLIADGQALARAGFRVFLEDASLIRVVGEAATGDEALDLARRTRPHVALVDADLPGVDCLEVTRRLLSETGAAVMLLTASERDEQIFAALRAGASGLLLKDTDPAELVGAIETLARGDASLSPGLTRRVIAELVSRPQLDTAIDGLLDELTRREREVMGLVALGLSNDEIAERIVVTRATAKTHVSRAMTKLRARDRAQLVVFAYATGLVLPRADMAALATSGARR